MRVLLYSGGLDSYIARKLDRQPHQLLYFNLRTRYTPSEILYVIKAGAVISKALNLELLERPNAFVPQRNALLVALAQAMCDADEVMLCAVKGEYSRDKHTAFFKRTSALLSYTTGKPVRVYSPLLGMTKTQAVAAYLKAGGDAKALVESTMSCYSVTDAKQCGRCMSCFRRWVALENNGLTDEWEHEPWIDPPRESWRALLTIPISTLPGFARAQWDVITAYQARRSRLA